MKLSSLLAGVALGAIAAVGLSTGAQARFDVFIDTGDYWRHHRYDYCYYHDCGDRWYIRHHRHRFRERDWWRDHRDRGWHDGGADGDWGDDGDHHRRHHHDDDDDY